MSTHTLEDDADRRIYRHPPVVEALCEFEFVAGSVPGLTVPGRLYDRLSERYPEAPEQQERFQAGLVEQPEDSGAALSITRQVPRIAFRNKNQLAAVGENVLSIHGLKPYEGWESMQRRTADALAAYVDAAQPKSVSRVGLRYVNRIVIPSEHFEFDEYFEIGPPVAPGFPDHIEGFLHRLEMRYDDVPIKALFTWASAVESGPGKSAFILDFDLNWVGEVGLVEAMERLSEMRRRERKLFESVVGEKLRSLFDEE